MGRAAGAFAFVLGLVLHGSASAESAPTTGSETAESTEAVAPGDAAPAEASARPDDLVEAARAFETARERFEAGQHLEAARLFESALELAPHPAVHFNAARAYELAGRRGAARRHYRAFLDSAESAPESRRIAQARVAALSVRPAHLVVTTQPPGGRVAVDGRGHGQEPVSVLVQPGRHEVEVQLLGLRSHRSVVVAEGERRRIAFVLGSTDAVEARGEAARPRRHHPRWFWGMLGLELACTVTTVALYAAAAARHDELREAGLSRYSDATYQTTSNAAGILLGVSLLLSIPTAVLAAFTDWGALSRARLATAAPRGGP